MTRSHPSNASSPTDSRHPQDDNPDPSAPAAAQSSIPSTPTASIPGSEGYPSWLPKRPPPPAPGSTLHSLSTNVMFGPDVGPATDLPTGSPHGSEHVQVTTPQPPQASFAGGRKPTPRSVRIVSMQDSPSASGGAGMVSRRETDQTTTRVSSFPFGFGSRIWSRATASPLGHSPTLLSQTPDATHSHSHGRLRSAAAAAAAAAAASAAQPKFRAPGLHLELLRDPSWKTRLHFYLFPLLVFAHIPMQTFFDFNAVFILIEVAKFPNPDAPGVPGSGRNWVLGAAAYIASWVIWFFGVFLGYELFYSFYRRWRFRRPLILPIYLSSPAFNFVSITSYNHFCFLQHIRNSAFPRVNPSAVLPSAEGSLRDALAETCYFYAQNLPTVVTLLPRAGLALALLLSFFSPEHLPGGLSLSDVDQSIARRDGTFFNKSTGALSGYAKGVLIANAAWTAWRTLVLLLSWVGLWIFSGHGCAGLCGPRSRMEEEEFGRSASIYSEKSDAGAGAGASGTEALPWSWKECTLLRVQEAYDFCLTLRAPRQAQVAGQQPQEGGGFDGIEKVFAAVGLGGAATQQPPQARRGMLSRDLFESPKDAPSRKSSPANGQGQGQEVVPPLPEARVRETTMEGGKNAPIKNLPYPFPGFGPRESSEQEQVPFPPSPGLPDEGEEGDHDGEGEGEEGEEGDIVVEVDKEGEEVEFEEEEAQPRTSEEPSSFSGRASNSLSSLGQPIPSRYPFSFRHPGRGGSISSTGSPPFAFSRATATPQSKSTSTRASRETRSTGNAETTTDASSPSAGSPVSVGAASSSVHSPQDPISGMPMPPRHPGAGASGRQRAGTVPIPVSPTPPGAISATRPRQQLLLDEHHHRQQQQRLSTESIGSGSDREDDHASRSGQPSPDGSLEAREREDSVGLLSPSPPSSQSSPRVSLLGSRSRNGSAASLARISGAFRPRSRSRHTSSGSGTGTGSGASSRHNSHVSLSSVSLALGGHRARAHSLIQSIADASHSSIELVLGRTPSSQPGAVRLGEASDADASASDGGALSNPENHTFGMPVVGGAGTALPRRAGMRARTLESTTARSPPISPVSSVSVSSSSARGGTASRAAAAAAAAAARTRSASSSASSASSQRARAHAHARVGLGAGLQTARSFASEQGSPPSILTRSVRSDGSTQTQTQLQGQAQPQPQPPSPPVGVPIPQSQSQAEAHPDLSTAAASLVTTPPTIASETTDSSGRTPRSLGGMEHYAPPHARNTFMPR
ncbi:hypothetical protein BJY52DRAFT_1187652 [Lactarius psammicola]|nr:hypothetical protein BJY52DRAFT_1187652 [Lactarius psammicola]